MSTTVRNILIAAIVVVTVGVGAFFVLSSNDDGTATPATTTAVTPASTATSAVSVPATADPTAVLPNNGAAIQPGSIDSSKQDLSAACTDAVKSLRELMTKYKSGLLIDQQADLDIVNSGIKAAKAGCSPDEFKQFYDKEWNGWFNGATGFVPPASGDVPATTAAAATTTAG